MSYDIFNMTCPQCGKTERFRVEIEADAIVVGGEIVETELLDVFGDADASCLSCGYNGLAKEFCEEEE